MVGAFFATGRIGPNLNSLKRWLGLLIVAEVLAFLVMVKLIGTGPTLLAMFLTSVLGVAVLRRVGLGAAQQLRRQMVNGGPANEAFIDGSLTAFGALLLILPGFVSDVIGMALATPSIRQHLASRFLKTGIAPHGPMPKRTNPDVIDLGPDDWRVVDHSTRP